MDRLIGYIGKKSLSLIKTISDLLAFTYRLFVMILKRPVEGRALVRKAIVEQIYFTGVEALPSIIPIALIVGSMLIVQFTKVSGEYDLGKTTILLIVREIGPIYTALVVILRSATAVTIEMSYMNVFNEIDSMEMAGIDPMRLICIPRLVGITSAIICLFIVFDLVSIIGGYALVWTMTDIHIIHFLGQVAKALTVADIVVGFLKAICFGMIITVVALYRGFGVKKRITDIPARTSKSAIECFTYCLVANIIISIGFYI